MHCVEYVTKVNDSKSLNDCIAKNEQVKIDNMDATTTVGNIKKSSAKTYANGKGESRLVGTSESYMGINATIDTVSAPIAATAIDIVQMKGKIYHTVFWLNNFRSAISS